MHKADEYKRPTRASHAGRRPAPPIAVTRELTGFARLPYLGGEHARAYHHDPSQLSAQTC
jgi:hypothetical protein